jgi:23S rRNA pseudouridine1911/1915/1917 synthase
MLVAKNDVAHQALSAQLATRTLSRTYYAIVWGMPTPRAARINQPIGRSPHDRKKMAVVKRGGKEAITDYEVVRPVGLEATLVECKLQTGRTHQIRVHLAHIGHPIVGDAAYGRVPRRAENEALKAFPRQALHALEISFIHPRTGEKMSFEGDLPGDIQALIE